MTFVSDFVVAKDAPEVTDCADLADNLSLPCVALPADGSTASFAGVRGSPPKAVSNTPLISVPLADPATSTLYVTDSVPATAISGLPVQVTTCPAAVQANSGAPAVCALKLKPVGNVSVNVTTPLVALPPLFSNVIV